MPPGNRSRSAVRPARPAGSTPAAGIRAGGGPGRQGPGRGRNSSTSTSTWARGGQERTCGRLRGDRVSCEMSWRCALGIAQTLGAAPRAAMTTAQAPADTERHGERWARARLLRVLGRRVWELGEQIEAKERTLSAVETLGASATAPAWRTWSGSSPGSPQRRATISGPGGCWARPGHCARTSASPLQRVTAPRGVPRAVHGPGPERPGSARHRTGPGGRKRRSGAVRGPRSGHEARQVSPQGVRVSEQGRTTARPHRRLRRRADPGHRLPDA